MNLQLNATSNLESTYPFPKADGPPCICRWDPHYEDKQKFIRKLKIDVTEIKEDDVAIPEDAKESPINQFKLKFMNTGDYLRPHDMRYCIEKVRSLCSSSLILLSL